MTTPDLLVNLIVAPIAFLLLVVVREWLHRILVSRTPRRTRRSGARVPDGRPVFIKRKSI